MRVLKLHQAYLYWIQVVTSTRLPCQVSAVAKASFLRVMQNADDCTGIMSRTALFSCIAHYAASVHRMHLQVDYSPAAVFNHIIHSDIMLAVVSA